MDYIISTIIISLIIVSILRYLNFKSLQTIVTLLALSIASPYVISAFYCQILSLGCAPDALDGLGFIIRSVVVFLVSLLLDFGIKNLSKKGV